ncbi:MAG: hypothetical protein AAGH40_04075, partial [Verrucomicrobiota bacterium]
MNRSIFLILYFSAVCFVSATTIKEASVTMPYTELSTLLERLHDLERLTDTAKSKPQVTAFISSAEYTVDCRSNKPWEVRASFDVSNISSNWQSVPLIEAVQAIDAIEPKEAKVVEIEGMLHLLMEPESETAVIINFKAGSVPLPRGAVSATEFNTIGASSSRLQVIHDSDDTTVVVSGAVQNATDDLNFGLPSSGGPVGVTLYKSEQLIEASWNGLAQYLVNDGQGSVDVLCRLDLTAADNGQTNKVQIRLPKRARIASVQCEDEVGPYRTEITELGQLIYLDFTNDKESVRLIEISYRYPLEQGSERWLFPGVEVMKTKEVNHRFYISQFSGFELIPASGGWTSTRRTPDWISKATVDQPVYFYDAGEDSILELGVSLLPRLNISEATISEASYETEIVVQGGMLHKATVEIEDDALSAYDFKLPEGSRLLSFKRNGLKTDPLIMENGMLKVVLPKTKSSKSLINYTYTTEGTKLNPVEGKIELSLPKTSLFVHKLKWSVQLPRKYEATAVEGNVVVDGGGPGQLVRFSKQLY